MTTDRNQSDALPIVLMADDDPSMRLLAGRALEPEKIKFIEAQDGQEALDLFKVHRPDLVLLDVHMPKKDGFCTCTQIRRLPEGRHTPIVMITSLDELDSIQNAYKAGATDFFTKPVNWLVLRERVRYILRANRTFRDLVESEKKNTALLEGVPDMIFQVARSGELLSFKAAKEGHEPFPEEDVDGRSLLELMPPKVAKECIEKVDLALKSEEVHSFEYPLFKNGHLREYEARAVASGEERGLVIVRDVTDRNQSARSLQKERDFVSAVLDTAAALVLVRDRKGRIVRFNRACERASQLDSEEVHRKLVWELLTPPEDGERERMIFSSLLSGQSRSEHEGSWIAKDGTRRLISWSNSVLFDGDGAVEHVISTGLDITDRKRAEKKIRFLAFYDNLTRLPNRVLFKEHLAQAISQAQREQKLMAVMFLDLDRFKQINDTFGHAKGDQVLRGVARKLRRSVRAADLVARDASFGLNGSIGRFGGDEFTILATNISSVGGAAKAAKRLLEALAEPLNIDGQEVFATVSIGISVYPFDGTDAETLLKNADTAMYYCKDRHRNNYHFYSDSMNATAHERLSLESDLRQAIEREELRLYYQPKIDVGTGAIVGCEALIRWQHGSGTMLMPSEFIQLAEETSLIVPIGEWVMQSACEQVKQWQQAGLPRIPVAVNLSSQQFTQRDLPETVATIVEEAGLHPADLELEITESTIMENVDEAKVTLGNLKGLGIKLSVDDFGTGYSSLNYLKRFPVDALKIDRAFVKDVVSSPDDRAIAKAIIAMGKSLRMEVIGEGVESQDQLEFLSRHGCHVVQGFLFSPPVPAEEFATLLRDHEAGTDMIADEVVPATS